MRRQVYKIGSRLILASVLTAASQALAAEPITTRGLLQEMTDLKQLAEFPSPTYTTKQFSSHSPKSKSPSDHDAWFANEDWDNWIRIEKNDGREERVMMESDKPGAVVRIWSANPAGTLRVYIDGESKPAIEAKMEDLLSGKVPGIPDPISGLYSKGYNLYLPMPYAKSCKITTDAKGFYYTVDYRTYPDNTPVTSFKADDIKALAEEIHRQADRLTTPAQAEVKPTQVENFEAKLAPGESKTLSKLSGANAISQLRFNVGEHPSLAALRGTVLRVTFDGETTVEVPLGDFFGTAPGINPFEALSTGMRSNGELTARWFMPFRASATIEVKNLSDEPLSFTGDVGTVAHEWTDRSMHFNAGYRAAYDYATRPMTDWNYLTAKGKGVFTGVSFAIDNPNRDWWGEGDEKFYVDGESFPSWFGTGSEDYYGYAWCWPGLFHHAYHNQPRCDGPANYGRTSVNRFHIMDKVPFNESYKFDMEIWHWKDCKVNLAVTTYWYATPGSSDEYKPLTKEDLAVRPMPPYERPRVAGVLEGESLAVLSKTAHVDKQDWSGLSDEAQLWWHDGVKKGDELVLGFDAPKAGTYQIAANFLKASDYGTVQLAVNGKELGGPIDLYNKDVAPSGEQKFGTAELNAGQNKLTVKIVGANEKSKKQYLFGLDYLKLEPASGGDK